MNFFLLLLILSLFSRLLTFVTKVKILLYVWPEVVSYFNRAMLNTTRLKHFFCLNWEKKVFFSLIFQLSLSLDNKLPRSFSEFNIPKSSDKQITLNQFSWLNEGEIIFFTWKTSTYTKLNVLFSYFFNFIPR